MSGPTHRSAISATGQIPPAVRATLRGIVRWHRESGQLSGWTGEIGGVAVAHAVMTGRPGVDDYPWDWSTSDTLGTFGIIGSGVTDTLRTAKEKIANALEEIANG